MTAVERRRYPRIAAPVVFAPMGLAAFHHRRASTDISEGGMRLWSDERLAAGQRLELELLMPDDTPLQCWVMVVWVDEMASGSEARFDVGAQFLDLAEADRQRLASVLTRA